MSNSTAIKPLYLLAAFLLLAVLAVLSWFFTSNATSSQDSLLLKPVSDGQLEQVSPSTSINKSTTNESNLSPVSTEPLASETSLTPQQIAISGLTLQAASEQTDELLRDVEIMNKRIEVLLEAPDLEARQQADNANDAQSQALALIQQVDAELGVDSLQIVDQQFELSSNNIADPELQKFLHQGAELEAEIATIAQSLQ